MEHRHAGLYDTAFGADPAFWQAASPIHHLTQGMKPWQGVCSDPRLTSCATNRDYAAKAKALGSRAEVLPIELGHGKINFELGEPGAYTDAVEKFMASLDERVKALLAN
jgi:hypothetical protein